MKSAGAFISLIYNLPPTLLALIAGVALGMMPADVRERDLPGVVIDLGGFCILYFFAVAREKEREIRK